jgi:hypothetical protein
MLLSLMYHIFLEHYDMNINSDFPLIVKSQFHETISFLSFLSLSVSYRLSHRPSRGARILYRLTKVPPTMDQNPAAFLLPILVNYPSCTSSILPIAIAA